MKQFKKICAAGLALAIMVSFTACGKLRISTDLATVDGSTITVQEVKYYLLSVKEQLEQEAGEAGTKDDFWKNGEIDGKPAAEVARQKAMDNAIRTEIAAKKAQEKGLTIDSSTQKQIKDMINSKSKEQKKTLDSIYKATGLNDQLLQSLMEKEQLATLFEQDATTNDPALSPSEEEINGKLNKDYSLVKHVLIKTEKDAPEGTDASASPEPMTDEEKAEKKKLAEDIMNRAKAGEDFDALVAEYGEDPGMESTPKGYVVYKGSGMVAPFEEAALKLNVGEVSDIVESDFGYHILKKYDLVTDDPDSAEQYKQKAQQALSLEKIEAYLDSMREGMTITINQNRLDGIKVANLVLPTASPTPKTSGSSGTGSVPSGGVSSGTSSVPVTPAE